MKLRILSFFIPILSILTISAYSTEEDGKDNFDFLSTRHPVSPQSIAKLKAIDESKLLTDKEKESLFNNLKVDCMIRAYFIRDVSLMGLKQKDPRSGKVAALTDLFKGMVEENPEVCRAVEIVEKQQGSDHERTPSEQLYFKRKADKHLTTREDVVLVARRLVDIALRAEEKQTVVLLGRTPGLIKVALEEYLKIHPDLIEKMDIVHVNFSGHPDALSLRDAEKKFGLNEIIARETVTPESLSIFLTYLESLNLHTAKSIMYVDMMNSGGGNNGFLRVYHKLCEKNSREPSPLHFMCLTNEPTLSQEPQKAWVYKDGMIIFNDLPTVNIKPYQVRVTPLFIGRTTLKMLDCPEYQCYLYSGKYMPACRWTEDYISSFSKLTPLQESCDQFFRVNFKKLIQWHDSKTQKAPQ